MSGRKPVFWIWLMSCLMVAMLSLAVGSTVYYARSTAIVYREILNVNQLALEQARNYFDGKLLEAEGVLRRIALNEELLATARSHDSGNQVHRYRLVSIQRDLANYLRYNRVVLSTMVYFKRAQLLLSDKDIYQPAQFELLARNHFGLDSWEMQQVLEGNMGLNYRFLIRPEGETAALMLSVPVGSATPLANIVVFLDARELSAGSRRLRGTGQGAVSVLDGEGKLRFGQLEGRKELVREVETQVHMAREEPYFVAHDSQGAMCVSYIPSQVSNWSYVCMTPQDQFLEKLNDLKRAYAWSFVVFLAAGGLLAYLFAWWNYKKLNPILGLFKGQEAFLQEGAPANEFKAIEQYLRSMSGELAALRSEAKNLRSEEKDHLLELLFTEEYRPEWLERLGLPARGDVWVVLLDVEQPGEQEGQIALQPMLESAFESWGARMGCGRMGRALGMYCGLMRPGQPIAPEQAREALGQLQEFICCSLSLKLLISCSGPCPPERLARGFERAREVMEYQAMTGDEGVLLFQEIDDGGHKPYPWVIGRDQALANSIEACDFHLARQVAQQMIDELRDCSMLLIRYRVFNLIDVIVHALHQVVEQYELNVAINVELIKRLAGCDSLPAIKQEIGCIFDRIQREYESGQRRQSDRLVMEIQEYVRDNLADQNLSVSDVAEQFGMSQSNLSKYFRRQTGVKMLDYIHTERLARAKALLTGGQHSVQQVAEQVGYLNSVAMIRAFKRYEGVTPGRFRENNK